MTDPDAYHVLRLPAVAESAARLRKEVMSALNRWGRPELVDDAALCATELASNAVLHGRGSFEVTLRPAGGGLRIEVIDGRSDELPIPVPTAGTAADITRNATTGRGLLIVATIAARWGFTATATGKSVWVELDGRPVHEAVDPVVIIDRHPPTAGPIVLALLAMPVRAAVMSGVQVDDLVREIQLRGTATFDSAAEEAEFFDLLDRSAHPRLSGRYAALRAAGVGETRFDVDIATSIDAVMAIDGLSRLLAAIPERLAIPAARVRPEVDAFRAWLSQEVAAQAGGRAPARCDLPA